MSMKSLSGAVAPVLVCLTALTLLGAADAETVSWGNIKGRNMVLPAENLPADLTDANTLWHHETRLHHQYGQPAIVGDRVLVGAVGKVTMPAEDGGETTWRHGQVLCLDLGSGELVWRLTLGFRPYGVVATYAVEGDRIYFVHGKNLFCADLNGMADGNDGVQNELKIANETRKREMFPGYALPEGPNGDVLWRVDFEPLGVDLHDAASGTPLILGDVVWVTTSHSLGMRSSTAQRKGPEDTWDWYGGKPGVNLVAVDKMTGDLLAIGKQAIPEVFHSQWSSVAAGEVNGRPLVFWGDGYGFVHAFAVPEAAAEGEPPKLDEVWRLDANPHRYRYKPDGSERPYPFTMRRRTPDWEQRRLEGPGHIISTPVFHDGRLYVAIGRDIQYTRKVRGRGLGWGAVTCIDPAGSGDITATNILWRQTDIGRTQATPSILDGLMYIASLDGYLYCLDIGDGTVVWKHDLGHAVGERSQLVADGKIYVATDRGEMFVFRTGREPELLSETRLRGAPSTPVAVDNLLIVGNERGVKAYRKGAGAESKTPEAGE